EQDWHLAAEAEILAPLADVETEGHFTLARFIALNEGQGIFHFHAAQVGGHWLLGEYLDGEETLLVGLVVGLNRSGLRARDAQRLGDGTVVDDLQQDGRVAALL